MIEVLIFSLILVAYLWVRMEWIHSQEIKILEEDSSLVNDLPSHSLVMIAFWVWDMKKLLKKVG